MSGTLDPSACPPILTRFASTMLDLNSALTDARGWAELAEAAPPAGVDAREGLANIRASLVRVEAAARELWPLMRLLARGTDRASPVEAVGDLPALRTPRLLLRRLVPADAPALSRYRDLPEVARYQSWDSFTLADAERLVADQQAVAREAPGTWLQLGMVADAALVGDLGIHTRADDPQQVELGITLDPAHQGRGYAAEAISAALDYVFGTLGKHRATATTDAANGPAAALFARLGFRREGHYRRNVWFKGGWGDEFLFALLRDEWMTTARGEGS